MLFFSLGIFIFSHSLPQCINVAHFFSFLCSSVVFLVQQITIVCKRRHQKAFLHSPLLTWFLSFFFYFWCSVLVCWQKDKQKLVHSSRWFFFFWGVVRGRGVSDDVEWVLQSSYRKKKNRKTLWWIFIFNMIFFLLLSLFSLFINIMFVKHLLLLLHSFFIFFPHVP